MIFVISTTGQGEFPQNGRAFWRALLSKNLRPGVLRKVRFSSFGLGDSSYARYNVAHRMLHARLVQLGATAFCERGEGNEQHPEGHSAGFREWLVRLRDHLLRDFPLVDRGGLEPVSEEGFLEPKWWLRPKTEQESLVHEGRNHSATPGDSPSTDLLPLSDPYTAKILTNERMTAPDHFQDVRLFDFILEQKYSYGPGAVAVVYPKNFPEDVESFIRLVGWEDVADTPLEVGHSPSPIELVTHSPLRHLDLSQTRLTLRWLLENVLDIMSIPRRSFFALLLSFVGEDSEDEAYQKERLRELANAELIDELWDYTTRPKRTILEVMMDFTTVKIPWKYALTALPIMRGRQFSIASGGKLKEDKDGKTRVQLLVAIVDPPSPIIKWRRRYGVCTRYMAVLQPADRINIGMQQGYLDVRPSEMDVPLIMVGPGTGVAPMRAMIQQRAVWAADGQKSRAVQGDMLFFGCRSERADYFFRDEWASAVPEPDLRVVPAFSREQDKPKQYVQDQIRANAARVARAVMDGRGKVYVCGSSGNMPKGVREALVDVLTEEGGMSKAEAEAYLDGMEKTGRYKQETW